MLRDVSQCMRRIIGFRFGFQDFGFRDLFYRMKGSFEGINTNTLSVCFNYTPSPPPSAGASSLTHSSNTGMRGVGAIGAPKAPSNAASTFKVYFYLYFYFYFYRSNGSAKGCI